MSKVTLQSCEAYDLCATNISDTVDKCVSSTSLLISKADQLNSEMPPIHQIAAQMYFLFSDLLFCFFFFSSLIFFSNNFFFSDLFRREIKKTLEILEEACK